MMSSHLATAAAQQKFTELRKRLDQLGYRQTLGIESLPLVEKLFFDLVHTTDSLKKAKLQHGKVGKDQSDRDALLEPYKSDNAKLMRENNDLHQQLIKTREELESSLKDLKGTVRQLEHQNADLRFLNDQYVHKVRALEKESKLKTDKILLLQEKNFHAVVMTPAGHKKNIPFRRQRMEIDTLVPPTDKAENSASLVEDPYVADLLQVADSKIAELNEMKKIIEEEKQGLQEKVKQLIKQVDTRDGEIERLSRMLDGGRPHDVVALDARNRANERLISHLNIQIDYLQSKNKELQDELDNTLRKTRMTTEENLSLGTRNASLSRNLEDVDWMARQLQRDKDVVVRTADVELQQARSELDKSRTELDSLDLQLAQLTAEKDRLMGEVSGLQTDLSTEVEERQQLEDLLDKVQEDKKNLANRINKLTANEKELVLEIDRLKHGHRNGMVKKRGKSPDRTAAHIRGLEQDRDYWKKEVETLQKLLKSRLRLSRSRSPARSPTRSRSPMRSPTRSLNSTPSGSFRKGSPVKNNKKEDKKEKNQELEAMLRLLEDERDHYRRECEILRSFKHRSSSPERSVRNKLDDGELARVLKERDELQSLLDKFERHMAEIQGNVKVLTSERDKLSTLYEETRQELDRVRREVVRSPKSAKTSLAAQAVLRRVENERDDAIAELRRMTTERDSLRERLKIATDGHLSDRARLEQKMEDMEAEVVMSRRGKAELESRCESLQHTVNTLEMRIQQQALSITDAKDSVDQQKATASQMRLLAGQAERSLDEVQQRLIKKEAECRNLEEKVLSLERHLAELSDATQTDADEIVSLRTAITSLDKEKDILQADVDDKTERLVALQTQLTAKEKAITQLKTSVQELEAALDHTNESMMAREREIGSLRRQLDSTSEELTDNSRSREVVLRENRRLQDDLTTMTRENQNLHAELSEAMEERDQYREQVQDYVMEIKRIEELLAAKENERSDLLEQYRSLSQEAERHETQSHQLESESSNLRLEIMTRDSELRRLRERQDTMQREIQASWSSDEEHIETQHSYEMQVSQLTRSMAALEEALRTIEQEKDSLLGDLAAVRDLCTKLEMTKDNLQRQLTTKMLDHEKLETQMEEMKNETLMLRSQVNNERSSLRSLEGLLSSNRDKEFQTHLAEQERSAEIQLLRDRIAINDSKLESHQRELTLTRSKNLELETEVERLRRQLTNERFERERCVQELRRNGLNPPGEGRLSRTSQSPAPRSLSPNRMRSLDSFDDDHPSSLHTV